MIQFNLTHHNQLSPIKLKWETFKVNKTLGVNDNEKRIINSVTKEIFGTEPSWCCAESLVDNIKRVMNLFDIFEKENSINNPVSINQIKIK